jgi:HD-GYP domain-containing protein (c-di-GMP phosphodiesterase class II)
MSETKVLLAKISALRQRLAQAQSLANEARSAAAALAGSGVAGGADLELQLANGSAHDACLDALAGSLPGACGHDGAHTPPRQLSWRARRVVERGQGLLAEVRALADGFPQGEGGATPEPLTLLYRETVALIETVVRTVALLPDSVGAQLHFCQGLEVALEVVAGRLRTLVAGAGQRRQEAERIARLAELLAALAEGKAADAAPFRELADQVIAEANEGGPLNFAEEDFSHPARAVAAHGLNVARVMARVVRHDPTLRDRAPDAVLAALVHDAGMLRVPAEVLAQAGPLDDDQRARVEAHCRLGSEQVLALLPEGQWLAEAVHLHHERQDGTGYPDGRREEATPPLARFLAVCDTYAALCCARPHRPARPTRTALADTLLLSEQGQLDRHYAECLLHLSFYPVGSVVEMAHGAVGVVVATPGPRRDLNSPARPVVALLTDGQGAPLPRPHHLDLAQSQHHSIVRTVSAAERRELLGRFPEWAA